MRAPAHPTHPCQQCRWCNACGCERGGVCHQHHYTELDLGRVKVSRATYEVQRANPDNAFAEFGSRDKPGKIHTLNCHVVRSGIEASERFLSDPLGHPYAQRYPRLLNYAEAEAPGRQRCTQCVPDVRERKRPPRIRLSGLGWPLDDQKCARSPGPARFN